MTADKLADYRRRRDFSSTGEPKGRRSGRSAAHPTFVPRSPP
ncbi:hypothetical protein ABIA33_007610 [Streptacidiphilus sp. MAP12-16]